MFIAYIFFCRQKNQRKGVLNILSMDNSSFNSWNSHCSWTKEFLSVERLNNGSKWHIQFQIANYEVEEFNIAGRVFAAKRFLAKLLSKDEVLIAYDHLNL